MNEAELQQAVVDLAHNIVPFQGAQGPRSFALIREKGWPMKAYLLMLLSLAAGAYAVKATADMMNAATEVMHRAI